MPQEALQDLLHLRPIARLREFLEDAVEHGCVAEGAVGADVEACSDDDGDPEEAFAVEAFFVFGEVELHVGFDAGLEGACGADGEGDTVLQGQAIGDEAVAEEVLHFGGGESGEFEEICQNAVEVGFCGRIAGW